MNILNRKELLTTFSLEKQAEIRELLGEKKIEHQTKTVHRRSSSPFCAGPRAITGSFLENEDLQRQYIIYVLKRDYEEALYILNSQNM